MTDLSPHGWGIRRRLHIKTADEWRPAEAIDVPFEEKGGLRVMTDLSPAGVVERCDTCGGRGVREWSIDSPHEPVYGGRTNVPCTDCDGGWRTVDVTVPCPWARVVCPGDVVLTEHHEVLIVFAVWEDGTVVLAIDDEATLHVWPSDLRLVVPDIFASPYRQALEHVQGATERTPPDGAR